jgi:hypothetical protein
MHDPSRVLRLETAGHILDGCLLPSTQPSVLSHHPLQVAYMMAAMDIERVFMPFHYGAS